MKTEKITINKSIEIFIKNLSINNKSNNTIKAYKNDINIFREFIKNKLNNKIIYTNQIKIIHLELYKEFLIYDKNYSNKTSSRKFNCLRTYLKTLNRYEYVNDNIIKLINNDNFGNKKSDKSDLNIKIMSDNTVREILKRLDNSTSNNKFRDKSLIEILLYTGIRRNELLSLKWSNINFEKKEMLIIREKTSNIDIVSLPEILISTLKKYYINLLSEHKLSDYVFNGQNVNSSLSKTAYNKLIKKITRDLVDISGHAITGHTFRHTFITKAMNQNISISIIQKYVGISLETLEHYTHLIAKDTIYFSQKLNNLYI